MLLLLRRVTVVGASLSAQYIREPETSESCSEPMWPSYSYHGVLLRALLTPRYVRAQVDLSFLAFAIRK